MNEFAHSNWLDKDACEKRLRTCQPGRFPQKYDTIGVNI